MGPEVNRQPPPPQPPPVERGFVGPEKVLPISMMKQSYVVQHLLLLLPTSFGP